MRPSLEKGVLVTPSLARDNLYTVPLSTEYIASTVVAVMIYSVFFLYAIQPAYASFNETLLCT